MGKKATRKLCTHVFIIKEENLLLSQLLYIKSQTSDMSLRGFAWGVHQLLTDHHAQGGSAWPGLYMGLLHLVLGRSGESVAL